MNDAERKGARISTHQLASAQEDFLQALRREQGTFGQGYVDRSPDNPAFKRGQVEGMVEGMEDILDTLGLTAIAEAARNKLADENRRNRQAAFDEESY